MDIQSNLSHSILKRNIFVRYSEIRITRIRMIESQLYFFEQKYYNYIIYPSWSTIFFLASSPVAAKLANSNAAFRLSFNLVMNLTIRIFIIQ